MEMKNAIILVLLFAMLPSDIMVYPGLNSGVVTELLIIAVS